MLAQEIVREWAKDKQRDKDRETKFQSISSVQSRLSVQILSSNSIDWRALSTSI